MNSRRKFISTSVAGLAGISLLPAVNSFAATSLSAAEPQAAPGKFKLRFALVSDGHYAQPNTESDRFYGDMIGWMQKERKNNQLDLVIVNGDLVHDRPDLLPKVKSAYLDKIGVPVFTVPGNHDHADAKLWKSVFGYEDNHVVDRGDIGIVFGNTSNTEGKYVAPDIDFLKRSFEQFKNKAIVFVILHIPPRVWSTEEKNLFVDSPEAVQLMQSYPNIKATFHGHDHMLDTIRYSGKLPHLFDSHFGGDWGTSYKGYRIVEVSEDNKISSYQVNATMNPDLNSLKLG